MLDFLFLITQRPIVITFAIIGALLVTAGSLVAKPAQTRQDPNEEPSDGQSRLSRTLTRTGYAITMVSITLFIIAGFISDL